MNKAVIYARVSSKDQEVEGFSIPAQLKLLNEYANKHGHLVIQEFFDVDTGKKVARKAFTAMIKLLKDDRTIQHILVEKTDRLTRNFTSYVQIDNLIDNIGLQVHLVKENSIMTKDSRSNEKFIFGIKVLVAKNFSDNLSEEVKKGMLEKASQGMYPSGAPYGYMNVREPGKRKGRIEVDPKAAPFVKKLFELYATGEYSLLRLRQKMIADGMVYRNGKNFYTSTIELILKNEFYTGVFYWADRKYENALHDPIVSKELFRRVQNVLANPYKSKSRKGLFPYTNLIRCGICGCRFTAVIKKEKYIYYHCTGAKGKCPQDYLKQEMIEAQFLLLFKSLYITDEVQAIILQSIRDSMKDKIEYHNAMVEQLTQQIKRLQNRLDQAYLDKLDGKIGEEFWYSKAQEWSGEKENLSIKLLAFQRADTLYLENTNFILELAKNAAQRFESGSVEGKRRVIDTITGNCVYKDGNLDVELKSVFSMIVSTEKTGNWCARQDLNLRPTD